MAFQEIFRIYATTVAMATLLVVPVGWDSCLPMLAIFLKIYFRSGIFAYYCAIHQDGFNPE